MNLTLLLRLEHLIGSYELHSLASPGPIELQPILEEYWERYRALPYFVQAMTLRWKAHGETQTMFALNEWLQDTSASADRRHARAHEFAHLFANHRGTEFVMWGADAGPRCTGLQTFINNKQEHQCECIAAILLVPVWMLDALEDYERSYIAAILDVPEHLVALRWELYQKYGR